MRKVLMTVAAVALATASGLASAKGCVTGAAVGGLAGHVAGHHGLIGAAAGCAINHHRNAVKDQKAVAATSQTGRSAETAAPAATAPSPAKQN